MIIEISVTSARALGDRPPREWVRKVLEVYPLALVLNVFTRIMHRIEISPDPLSVSRQILPSIARPSTVSGVENEVRLILQRGRLPAIFSTFLLLNFLKEGIRYCAGPPTESTLDHLDMLFRAYLATHDHFQDILRSPGREMESLARDVIRQSFTGTTKNWLFSIPRYWALWITLPKQLGLQRELEGYLPEHLPRPISAFVIPLFSVWAYWGYRALSGDPGPVAFELIRERWDGLPQIFDQIKPLVDLITLASNDYKQHLTEEQASMREGEIWEYSFLTPSQYPLIRLEDGSHYCLSLSLLANVPTDGLYHRMLTACHGDSSRVNNFTNLFGQVFHEYVHDLWTRISGAEKVKRIDPRSARQEIADGVIQANDGIVVYDAKSRRPTLTVARTGDVDMFLEDLRQGVLKGARQIDRTVKMLRGGNSTGDDLKLNVRTIYPVVVTATHFPEARFIYDLIDEAIAAERLLQDEGVMPLLVIDVQSLEILEAVQQHGEEPTALLIGKARDVEARIQSVDEILFRTRGQIPRNGRLDGAFRAISDGLLTWLRTGCIDEEAIDRTIFS